MKLINLNGRREEQETVAQTYQDVLDKGDGTNGAFCSASPVSRCFWTRDDARDTRLESLHAKQE